MAGNLAASETPVGDDYKALVCVFLQGGQDSFNMLIPRGEDEYAEYAGVRRNLAIANSSLVPISPATSDGRSYGLHPSAADMATLFDDGDLSFVANVGTLLEPTTVESYDLGKGKLPSGLFSHADQEMQWHTAIPERGARTGWAGRMTDALAPVNSSSVVSSSISLGGANVFQLGSETIPYAITTDGVTGLTDWKRFYWRYGREAVTSQLAADYSNLLEKSFIDRKREAIDLEAIFSDALTASSAPPAEFSATSISKQLKMVYETIAARDGLGARRQTFFVLMGGWDHHNLLLPNHASHLSQLSRALKEFNTAISGLGISDEVTTFSASDFGRSLTSNGNGSDHGWGGNQIVMGGAVNGGDIFGEFPTLARYSPLDVGRGRLIPTSSVDEYFYELACWFGVPPAQIPLILPYLDRFYNIDPEQPPLGFMGAA